MGVITEDSRVAHRRRSGAPALPAQPGPHPAHVRDVTPKPDRLARGNSTIPAAPATAAIDSVVQAVHADAAAPDHWPPLGHGVHDVAPPPLEAVPLRQGGQVPLALKLPALHENWHSGDVARPKKLV